MKPVLVVLFVDALGWRLAGSRPDFAAGLPHRREIATILGFSSGALPTAFSGRPPRDHGRWLMYRRAGADGGVFRGYERFAWLPPRLRRSWRLRQWLTARLARGPVRGYFNLYEVPLDELARFDLAERADLFAPGGLPVDTLWDSLAPRPGVARMELAHPGGGRRRRSSRRGSPPATTTSCSPTPPISTHCCTTKARAVGACRSGWAATTRWCAGSPACPRGDGRAGSTSAPTTGWST